MNLYMVALSPMSPDEMTQRDYVEHAGGKLISQWIHSVEQTSRRHVL